MIEGGWTTVVTSERIYTMPAEKPAMIATIGDDPETAVPCVVWNTKDSDRDQLWVNVIPMTSVLRLARPLPMPKDES